MGEFDYASLRQFHHFFHSGHILELNTFRGPEAIEKYCRGCVKPIGEGLAYHCQPACNFLLHLTCSQIPHQITDHPACSHVLHLLPQPRNYAPSLCRCNACWQPITHGFSFHCSICRLDLHPSCANLPRRIIDRNHPHNSLDLCFIPPYPSKAFRCNVCLQEDQRSWNYHCSECDYDAHVNCTQIPLLRESLLNETSEAINRAYVDYTASSGPRHLERRFSEPPRLFSFPRPSSLHSSSSFQMQQQQYQPFQNPYNTMGNMFVRPTITAIMQTLLGSVVQSLMNPGGVGGGDGWGGFGGLNSSGNLSDIAESMFNFGFF
ncbi:hypothetical protein SUGI_0800060 [Cryptomeria japonica]|uniref:protein VACUOLELESS GAMETOPHYTES-like n=1 Tax=Cryptomeria japonica TaxID=3369 RepID=UPI002414C1CF|nr:protein VACUOLELESS GAMETOPHYTES-like [Cryptomeria japonica]GLJ39218.1 hypothetical protein SUGI_0800060 [Cryptomeria japonica]